MSGGKWIWAPTTWAPPLPNGSVVAWHRSRRLSCWIWGESWRHYYSLYDYFVVALWEDTRGIQPNFVAMGKVALPLFASVSDLENRKMNRPKPTIFFVKTLVSWTCVLVFIIDSLKLFFSARTNWKSKAELRFLIVWVSSSILQPWTWGAKSGCFDHFKKVTPIKSRLHRC